MKIYYLVTGDMKRVCDGLVDYVADGEIVRAGEENIPCTVGFVKSTCGGYLATHLFIKRQILKSGEEIEAQTIPID